MKTCPFSIENKCNTCNLFSEKENKCAILVISENIEVISNMFSNVCKETKPKRKVPPEYFEIPLVKSKPPMSPMEAEKLYRM